MCSALKKISSPIGGHPREPEEWKLPTDRIAERKECVPMPDPFGRRRHVSGGSTGLISDKLTLVAMLHAKAGVRSEMKQDFEPCRGVRYPGSDSCNVQSLPSRVTVQTRIMT